MGGALFCAVPSAARPVTTRTGSPPEPTRVPVPIVWYPLSGRQAGGRLSTSCCTQTRSATVHGRQCSTDDRTLACKWAERQQSERFQANSGTSSSHSAGRVLNGSQTTSHRGASEVREVDAGSRDRQSPPRKVPRNKGDSMNASGWYRGALAALCFFGTLGVKPPKPAPRR
jgi:hypothetical protein